MLGGFHHNAQRLYKLQRGGISRSRSAL